MDVWHFTALLERVVAPLIGLIGVIVGAWLTRSSQTNQWIRDRKLQEYTELLDVLVERKEAILLSKSTTITVLTSQQQSDEAHKCLAASKIFQNRLFIDNALRKIQALEKWSDIERMAGEPNIGVGECQAKFNHLIDAIKRSAQDVVR